MLSEEGELILLRKVEGGLAPSCTLASDALECDNLLWARARTKNSAVTWVSDFFNINKKCGNIFVKKMKLRCLS